MSLLPLELDGESLSLEVLAGFIASPERRVVMAERARPRVRRARAAVEAILAAGAPVYGINTGFGRLADRNIPLAKVRELQLNLIRSHAAGVGAPLGEEETRLLVLLRANTLCRGHSGVREVVIEALCALLNEGVLPVIPERGSVGASGDLAPLAHLALVLVGEGEAEVDGEVLPGGEALARRGLAPIALEAKEGLALINGTQMMTAIGARAAIAARRLERSASITCAMTIDALKGTDAAFDRRIHAARPHPGQIAVARNLETLLRASQIRESHRDHARCRKVQDPYSLRCAPQVHGAARDALAYVEAVLERELNATTDNPLLFDAEGEGDDALPAAVRSGGNFHGQPVALALDVLAIAVSELGAISERRIERLVNPDYSGLPAFLVRGEEGLHSGFMMAQVTAAALVSENKVLSHPASVDSIPTSAGFEDHVSMGVTAALKARQVLQNVEVVLGIELVCACQAIEMHRPLATSPALEAALATLRAEVAPLLCDRPLGRDLERAARLVREGRVVTAAEAALGAALA